MTADGSPERRAGIDIAVTLAEEALRATGAGTEAHRDALNAEARARRERYLAAGAAEDLLRVIEILGQLLADPGELSQARLHSTLAVALADRFERAGAPGDLDAAVEHHRAAVDAAEDADQRGATATSLAAALLLRHQHTGSVADLDAAVQWSSEAARGAGPHVRRATLNLASALYARYSLGGDRRDLDRTIEMLRAIPPPARGPQRAVLPNNLAGALLARYRARGDPADLDEAIGQYRVALVIEPPPAPDAASRLGNLGTALAMRFDRTGELRYLDEAVATDIAAVEATPPRSVELAAHLDGLAGLLEQRARLRRDRSDLETAHRCRVAALQAIAEDSPERRRFQLNLGVAMLAGAPDADTLAAAADLIGRAVAAAPPEAADRDDYLAVLGGAMTDLAISRHELDGADHAIGILQEIVDRTPAEGVARARRLAALAAAFRARFTMSGRSEDLAACFTHFRAACRLGGTADPDGTLGRARTWADMAVAQGVWPTAAEAYMIAVAALHELFRRQAVRTEQEMWLAQGTDLVADAAYALVRTGAVPEAAATLDAGRALVASETLETATSDLHRLPDGPGSLTRRFRDASMALRRASAAARGPAREG